MKFPGNSLRYLTWAAALALAAWILSSLPLDELWQSITQLQPLQWSIWIALNACIIALLTYRWLALTTAMRLPVKALDLLRVRQAGQLISFVTPGPQFGGEPLQIFWLWRNFSVPGHAAFLAVGLDRFYELWVNFAVLLIAVLSLLATRSVAFVNWHIIALSLVGVILLMSLFAWFVLREPQRIKNWIDNATKRWREHERLRNIDAHLSQLNDSLKQVITSQRPALGLALLISLLAWAGMISEFWLLLRFIDIPLDVTTFIFLFTVVRLAFLLPLPGGVGSVEAGLFWAFQSLDLTMSAAAVLIILMRLRDVVILLIGAALLPTLQSPKQPNKDI